jgi:hypothetical protein
MFCTALTSDLEVLASRCKMYAVLSWSVVNTRCFSGTPVGLGGAGVASDAFCNLSIKLFIAASGLASGRNALAFCTAANRSRPC